MESAAGSGSIVGATGGMEDGDGGQVYKSNTRILMAVGERCHCCLGLGLGSLRLYNVLRLAWPLIA